MVAHRDGTTGVLKVDQNRVYESKEDGVTNIEKYKQVTFKVYQKTSYSCYQESDESFHSSLPLS